MTAQNIKGSILLLETFQMTDESTETNEQTATSAKPKAVVETVTMTDGRAVEFVGKRKLLKESIFGVNEATGEENGEVSVRLDFRNGETRTFVLPAALLLKFAAHGAEQKLGDEVAGEDDVDDQVLSIDALIERLNNGEWTTKRESSGMAGTSVLLRAMIEYSGHPVEKVKEFLKPLTQAQKVALRNSPELKPIVEKIEAEKSARREKVDVSSLLGSLSALAPAAG